jgi:hypothetical protein
MEIETQVVSLELYNIQDQLIGNLMVNMRLNQSVQSLIDMVPIRNYGDNKVNYWILRTDKNYD